MFDSFFLLVLLTVACVARAGEGSGHVSLEGLQTVSEQLAPVSSTEGRGEFEYNRKFSLGERFTLRTHPFIYGNSVYGSWERQLTVDPREFFIEMPLENFYLRAGYETLKFEGTDGLNPMDIASMKDLGDPLASPTRASGGVHAGYSGESTDFEMMYIPRQTESSVPGENSQWWPRRLTLPLRSGNTELRLPDRVEYVVQSRREVDEALSNNVASRFQFRSSYADFAIAGYEGASQTPALIPRLKGSVVPDPTKTILQLESPVRITPLDYRVRTGSAILSIPLGSWIIRAATRHDQPLGDSIGVPTWSDQTVAGIEKTTELGSNSVTTIVQGSWIHRPEGSSLPSLQEVFDHAVLLGLRYPLGESWTILASGISMKDGSYVAQLNVTRRWESGWSIDGGWLGMDGPNDSLLGSFFENDRASLKMTRAF